MLNKSKKILLTLALGSLFVSQNGFADVSVSIMEMIDGNKYDSTDTTKSKNVKQRLNELAADLDGTTDISDDASKNIHGKVNAVGKNIDGADASSTSTLIGKETTLAGLISSGALDGGAATPVTLTTKVKALAGLISSGALDGDAATPVTLTTKVTALGTLINGSDATSTYTLSAKIGSKADTTVGTLTSGLFDQNDSIFKMVGYIYESVAGSGTWTTLMTDVEEDVGQNIAAYTAPSTVKGVLEALVARLNYTPAAEA